MTGMKKALALVAPAVLAALVGGCNASSPTAGYYYITPVTATPVIATPVGAASAMSAPMISAPAMATPVMATPVMAMPANGTPVIFSGAYAAPAAPPPPALCR